MKQDVISTSVKDIQNDIELARKAAERRLAAPPIQAGGQLKLLRKELIRVHAPDCVNKYHRSKDNKTTQTEFAPYHPNWVEKKTYRDWLAKGYEPVLNEGAILEDEGDVLMKCPQKLFQNSLQETSYRAAARIREPGSEKNASPNAVDETTTVVSREQGLADGND